MTTFSKDLIEINLSTDELMLKELERRDGIYSFIFHELEGPKSETPTISIAPEKLIDRTYTEAIERSRTGTTTTTKTTDELNDTDSNSGYEDSNNNLKIKVENAFNQRSHVGCHSNNTTTTATATKTKSITHSPPNIPTSLMRTLPTDTSSGTTTNATPVISIPSLFTTPTTTTTLADSVPPPSLSSLSSLNMRNYHEHFKTWHPPPSFVYDNPKLYAYIANCGFRVRLPTPRFSHISAPLVRNRRHALKETPQYKRMSELCMCAPVADLRTLFPHDPDVHAPFASSLPGAMETLTGLSDVTTAHEAEEEQVEELVEADSCCGGMTMVDVVSALK